MTLRKLSSGSVAFTFITVSIARHIKALAHSQWQTTKGKHTLFSLFGGVLASILVYAPLMSKLPLPPHNQQRVKDTHFLSLRIRLADALREAGGEIQVTI